MTVQAVFMWFLVLCIDMGRFPTWEVRVRQKSRTYAVYACMEFQLHASLSTLIINCGPLDNRCAKIETNDALFVFFNA